VYTELAEYGLIWAVVLAGAGVVLVATMLLLMLVIKIPKASKFVGRTLLRSPKLSGRLMLGFSLIGIVPVLALAAVLAVNAASALVQEQILQLEGQATMIADSVTPLIEQMASGIDALAGHVSARAKLTETELRDMLLRHHHVNQEFVSMWVARPDGQVIVATAASDGNVKPWRGPRAGVALMESFQPAVDEGALYVSPVFKGTAPAFKPMIVISAPVMGDANAPRGFLQAQLNVGALVGGIVDVSSSAGIHTVIVNAANRVVLASSGLSFLPFQNLAGHPLSAAAGSSGGVGFAETIEVTGESGSYVAVARPLNNGWRVFAVASRAGVLGLVMMQLGLALVWVPVVLLLARGLAGLYGSAVAKPLKRLDESLDVFDVGRTVSVVPPAPEDASEEVLEVYDAVRGLMRKSRDAYGNMLRAVNEGAELRQELENVVSDRENGVDADISAEEMTISDLPESDVVTVDPEATYVGRLDPVTAMAGQELFEEFLTQAWALGVTDGRPVSLLLFGITNGDEVTMKSVAKSLSDSAGRVLDMVARTEAERFSLLLPDTDLDGARAVAKRALKRVQSEMQPDSSQQALTINVGVVSIVPDADSDPRAFTHLAERVLRAAQNKGDGKIAYISSDGKVGWA
jgi:diguanylate cyclase (GGDEF)-like protein